MTRNRKSAKDAGTRFETLIAGYLVKHVANHIERRTRNGTKDRGDISGLRHMNRRIVVEVKDRGGQAFIGPWLAETEIERLNDDAGVGIVVAKRARKANPGEQLVLMTVNDLVALLTGHRPDDVPDGIRFAVPPDPWAEASDAERAIKERASQRLSEVFDEAAGIAEIRAEQEADRIDIRELPL